MNKILKRIFISISSIILLSIILFWGMFHNEILTLNSIEKIENTNLHIMEYNGDYGFDEFLKVGASSDSELIDFVTNRLLKGIPVKFSIPDLGCSTFAVRTPQGQHLFGRNFDLSDAPAMLVKTKPKGGYASISMVNLGFIGYTDEKLPTTMINSITTLAAPYAPIDGINDQGLAIGVLLIKTDATNQQTGKVDITTTTAIRMILDNACTVSEAIELLKQYDMHSSAESSYHFQICDKNADYAVVEYIEDELSVVKINKATNFLVTAGQFYNLGKGQDRFEILDKALTQSNNILDKDQAMDLLAQVSQNDYDPVEKKGSNTQWSAVYNLDDLTVDIALNRDYNNILSYSLN